MQFSLVWAFTFSLDGCSIQAYRLWMEHPSREKVNRSSLRLRWSLSLLQILLCDLSAEGIQEDYSAAQVTSLRFRLLEVWVLRPVSQRV